MDFLQNLHTHSVFCDGNDTPEELVLEAINKGFQAIGFSSHSYMKRIDKEYSMLPQKVDEYIETVNFLKKKYKDKIKIYLGIEADMYSNINLAGFDYLIGSVHYIKNQKGELIDFDCAGALKPTDNIENIIDEYFCDNGLKLVEAYYDTLSQLPKYGDYDIIGHFDVITKHNETLGFVDEQSKEYLNFAISAAEALRGKINLFEVNTGALSRGWRSIPYPSPLILKQLNKMGFGAVITSDCHNKKCLDFGFTEAIELLKECGFRERYILTDSGFKGIKL